ncbi:MAG: hypothetical protein ABW185_05065 [Sedimenticola sp.]
MISNLYGQWRRLVDGVLQDHGEFGLANHELGAGKSKVAGHGVKSALQRPYDLVTFVNYV